MLTFALLLTTVASADSCDGSTCTLVDDLAPALEIEESFDYFNSPTLLEPDYERSWSQLPLEGSADAVPWTDSYWPKADGGISDRWQTGEHRGYELNSQEQLMEMSEAEIALLSPAEKYDLLVGNYMYPLTYRIQAENGANESRWTGYCHGWTAASINYDEPHPVVMTNPDGLRIPFGSSDIKALLTYFEGEVVRNSRYPADSVPWATSARMMGSLCLSENPNAPECQDTNAGAFHIALTNQLGIRGEAFGVDATNTYEKWNQPVHDYKSEVLGYRAPSPGASPQAVEEVIVRSEVTWTAEVEAEWEALLGTPGHKDVTKTWTYTVELDAQGEIVGGQWILLLEDGGAPTLGEVIDHLEQLDENADGQPDLDEDQVKAIIWEHFDFPDYTWKQDAVSFSDSFRQIQSPYEVLANSQSTREKLFHYMAELGTLYEASRGNGS